eukprot:gene11726-3472_t
MWTLWRRTKGGVRGRWLKAKPREVTASTLETGGIAPELLDAFRGSLLDCVEEMYAVQDSRNKSAIHIEQNHVVIMNENTSSGYKLNYNKVVATLANIDVALAAAVFTWAEVQKDFANNQITISLREED